MRKAPLPLRPALASVAAGAFAPLASSAAPILLRHEVAGSAAVQPPAWPEVRLVPVSAA